MTEYTYDDFLATLDEAGQIIVKNLNNHITVNYPTYKPFDIKPKNKECREWVLNYRKKPKVGKPICNLYSNNNKLSVQFVFLTSMIHEVLLRQNEFNDRIRRFIFKHSICRNCRGKSGCQWRQYFYIHNKLIMTCPYPYIFIENAAEEDIKDLFHLIDLQIKHMTQDAKDIKGSQYLKAIREQNVNIEIVVLDRIDLDIDNYEKSDYVNLKKIEKYAMKYCITPMGINDGFWFYHDNKAVCGVTDDGHKVTVIPQGSYAAVIINNPLTLSAFSIWNYMVIWIRENNVIIRPVDLSDDNTTYFVKFYRQSGNEYMTMYIPIK